MAKHRSIEHCCFSSSTFLDKSSSSSRDIATWTHNTLSTVELDWTIRWNKRNKMYTPLSHLEEFHSAQTRACGFLHNPSAACNESQPRKRRHRNADKRAHSPCGQRVYPWGLSRIGVESRIIGRTSWMVLSSRTVWLKIAVPSSLMISTAIMEMSVFSFFASLRLVTVLVFTHRVAIPSSLL